MWVEFPMPPGLAEHERRFRESGRAPAEPKRASTVVLLRDAAPGFEAYLLRRVATMAFAASMYVFPGGAVDPRDEAVLPGWAGPTPGDWARRLDLPEATARAVVCAAVREVFEESGVLLAGPDGATVVGDVSGNAWEAARVALVARGVGFAEFLATEGLVLRSDLLVPWSRWITPEFEPRRYDTYFFVALLPAGQVTRDVGGEADRTVWVRPGDALDGRFALMPPTQHTLSGLAGYGSLHDVFTAAGEREPATPFRPRFV
jgi:8-oxo-dGTP pyrophosphatase MutT (NUDIX family)